VLDLQSGSPRQMQKQPEVFATLALVLLLLVPRIGMLANHQYSKEMLTGVTVSTMRSRICSCWCLGGFVLAAGFLAVAIFRTVAGAVQPEPEPYEYDAAEENEPW
jgi:hypothetical protein